MKTSVNLAIKIIRTYANQYSRGTNHHSFTDHGLDGDCGELED